jgi:hypothetical protein
MGNNQSEIANPKKGIVISRFRYDIMECSDISVCSSYQNIAIYRTVEELLSDIEVLNADDIPKIKEFVELDKVQGSFGTPYFPFKGRFRKERLLQNGFMMDADKIEALSSEGEVSITLRK